ncbi:MAG: NAD(P)-binding domain-containing protein [Firmicutes bacterium]|nr:NAD(P)-binding domain-containing protein [Bacillota bacterium]
MKIGIIGYGSMGKMLLWKFSENAEIEKKDLLVSNRTQEKLEEVREIAQIAENRETAKEADILFVCVRPVDLMSVLEEIRDVIKPDALLVSLNGSISFESIHQIISRKTAKVIPSLTAEIGRSQTLVCYDHQVIEEDKAALNNLLKCIGDVIELPEGEMGMGSELVSCMPGFIASIFDVICSVAEGHTSIPKEQIIRMVLHTMSATGDLMIQKGMTFDEVVNRVATKGGITEAGTKVIYENFPETAEELFRKTLEKRRQTAKIRT